MTLEGEGFPLLQSPRTSHPRTSGVEWNQNRPQAVQVSETRGEAATESYRIFQFRKGIHKVSENRSLDLVRPSEGTRSGTGEIDANRRVMWITVGVRVHAF
ncbi:MAG: hypothetical protein DWH91_01255 [Planctomycetota bacterium]|nr:MAG: hypothetical protein DWH91_01255 [Planctomycetota bacterium]